MCLNDLRLKEWFSGGRSELSLGALCETSTLLPVFEEERDEGLAQANKEGLFCGGAGEAEGDKDDLNVLSGNERVESELSGSA
jgi:hypothetical protein